MSNHTRADIAPAMEALDARHDARGVPRFNPAGPFWVDPDVLDYEHAHRVYFSDKAARLARENAHLRARVAALEETLATTPEPPTQGFEKH